MNDHPVASDLEAFLQGAASQEVNRAVVRHLLAACATCRGRLESMGWRPERLERLVSLSTSDPEELPEEMIAAQGLDHDYDQSFANALKACTRQLNEPTRRASEQLVESSVEELRSDELLVGAEDHAPEPRLVELLLARSHAMRYRDASAMLRWARAARTLAERCEASAAGGQAALLDLKARAWGQFANALRVSGRLQESATALGRAEAYAGKGSSSPSLKAQLFSWTASLRIAQRRFGVAITLLDDAAEILRRSGERNELAWCLSNKAIALVHSGAPEEAIRILNEAVQLTTSSDPRLLLAVHHNLIYCYVEAGRLQEALALFPQTRNIGIEIKDELVMLRLLWQEARILCELGMLEEAEAQFSRARDGFLERDLAYEAAVVSLDLTAVYVKLGLSAEVRRTIGDILPIFSSLRVDRELLASLIQLQQAEDQAQALQLIRVLSRELVAGPKLPPSV